MLEKITLSEFERQKLLDVLESLGDNQAIAQDFLINLGLEKRKIDFSKACELLLQSIKLACRTSAKGYYLVAKDKSEYEKDYILTKYCFEKHFGNLPAWFKALY